MKIERVTITGADDQIEPSDLMDLSNKYPFVEWGLLLSVNQQGKPRYPSKPWLFSLIDYWADYDCSTPLSGHLCGSLCRQIGAGEWRAKDEYPELLQWFDRFQLNFATYADSLNPETVLRVLTRPPKCWSGVQFIFQLHDFHHPLFLAAQAAHLNVIPMHDLSGGIGALTEKWPTAISTLCGYAGGLTPDNLEAQLDAIAKVSENRTIWIDVETGVRTDNQFDLQKVSRFLKIVKPHIGSAE